MVLAEAAVEVGADLSDLEPDVRKEVNKAFRGVNADAIGKRLGEDLGEGITRGADGRLRNAQGRFIKAGETLGEGITRGADGRLRDARGRFVKAGEDSGKGFGDGFEKSSSKAATRAGGSFSKSLGTALKGGLAGVAVAAAGALTAGFLGALEREKAVDRITASLSLTASESARAGDVAGSLYADAYGESLGEVTGAVEAVLSSIEGMTSASDQELESVTASILDIANAFDLDVGEAARNAGILMKTGLAADATEAADLITRSLQEVPSALRGEVSDATQEYSQFFAAVGIDGPEAMGLLVSATEDGQFGIDKMGDAIKEFSIRATDIEDVAAQDAIKNLGLNSEETAGQLLAGGDAANEAFNEIVNGLLDIDDSSKRSAAAIALFGTPLEDLGKAQIPEFLSGLTDTKTGLEEVDGAAANMGDTLRDNVATRLDSIKRSAQGLLTEGVSQLFTAFDAGKESVTQLGGAFTGTLEAFQPVRDTLVDLAQQAQERLAPVFATVGAKLRDDLIPALNEFGIAIAPIVDFIIQQFGPRLIGTFESVGIILGGLVDIVAGVFSTIAALIQGDWQGAWDGAKKILSGAGDILKGLLNQVAVFFGSSFDDMLSDAKRIGTNIRNAVSDRIGSMKETAQNLINSLPGIFRRAGSRMLQSLVDKLVPGPVRDKISTIVERIKSLLDLDLSSAGKEILKSLGQGMINGLSFVREQASAAAATIRSYFPFSPAKAGPLSGSGSPENSGIKIAEMISDGLSLGSSGIANTLNSELSPLSASRLPVQMTPRTLTTTPARPAAPRESASVINNVSQNFFGPTTSGGRLREIDWTLRYATPARAETGAGEAFAR